MPSLAELTEKELALPENYEKVRTAYFDCVDQLLVPESRRFADLLDKKIGPSFQSLNPDLYQKYQRIIVLLKFISLITLDEASLIKLFRFHLLDAFSNNIDLNERMTGRMYFLPDTVFEEERLHLLDAIKENNQKLGSQPIVLKGDTQPVAPLLKYWLADYDRTLGPEKQTDLQRQQYLAQNNNVKTLNPPEKDILAKVFQFYDNLKPFSLAEIDKYFTQAEPTGAPQEETPEQAAVPTIPVGPTVERPPIMPLVPREDTFGSQSSIPTPLPTPTPVVSPAPAPTLKPADTYKEPIEEKDLTGPQKPIARPAPRLSGNIIDLKDLDNR